MRLCITHSIDVCTGASTWFLEPMNGEKQLYGFSNHLPNVERICHEMPTVLI